MTNEVQKNYFDLVVSFRAKVSWLKMSSEFLRALRIFKAIFLQLPLGGRGPLGFFFA